MFDETLFSHTPPAKLKVLNKLPPNPEEGVGRFPSWLHRKLPKGGTYFQTNNVVRKYGLNTVCEEAKCPNRLECYGRKTATFLALGKECTRSCGFCDIDFSKAPKAPEADEPDRIAHSVLELGLKHVVITMVARDDLPDQGASHIAAIVQRLRCLAPQCTIELLTSDFSGNLASLDIVLAERPDVFNHNIETVRALSPRVRHKATYDRTLMVLKHAKQTGLCRQIKSGMMVGLGETSAQVEETIQDLYQAGCDVITIGQYLQADRHRLPVKAFIPPEQFDAYAAFGRRLGVHEMYCGPFVRSSYHASELAPEISNC